MFNCPFFQDLGLKKSRVPRIFMHEDQGNLLEKKLQSVISLKMNNFWTFFDHFHGHFKIFRIPRISRTFSIFQFNRSFFALPLCESFLKWSVRYWLCITVQFFTRCGPTLSFTVHHFIIEYCASQMKMIVMVPMGRKVQRCGFTLGSGSFAIWCQANMMSTRPKST